MYLILHHPATSLHSHPLVLCKIPGNIKVCAGNHNRYTKSPSPTVVGKCISVMHKTSPS